MYYIHVDLNRDKGRIEGVRVEPTGKSRSTISGYSVCVGKTSVSGKMIEMIRLINSYRLTLDLEDELRKKEMEDPLVTPALYIVVDAERKIVISKATINYEPDEFVHSIRGNISVYPFILRRVPDEFKYIEDFLSRYMKSDLKDDIDDYETKLLSEVDSLLNEME